jgi:hypothetical protein
MKKYGAILLALLACGAGYSAQQTDVTNREVRDPRQLEAILDANFADAESRLASAEAGTNITGDLTVPTNLTVGAVITALGADFIGKNTNSIQLGETDGTVTIGRVTAGTITVTTKDDDANAALTIEAGGTGALKLGDTGSTLELSSSDWTISPAGVIANCEMDAAQLAGNVAQARMTNALVDAIGPDQMSDADHGDVAWSSGVASVQAINSVAVATVTAGAAAGATALQPNTVVVTGVTNGVDTAEITVTNGLGAASTIVGIWSATSNGAASTDNLISLVATTGTLLSSTNSGTIVVITDSTGYAALTATVSAATTNYAAFIQNNGVRKSSAEMVFDGP